MDTNQLHPLEKVNSMVDLGVRFDNNLTFREYMSEKINKAYSILGIIKRYFIYMVRLCACILDWGLDHCFSLVGILLSCLIVFCD